MHIGKSNISTSYDLHVSKKVSDLERDFSILKNKIENSLPSYSVAKKFEAHSRRFTSLSDTYVKIEEIDKIIINKLRELNVEFDEPEVEELPQEPEVEEPPEEPVEEEPITE
jgi:hypothetical protein